MSSPATNSTSRSGCDALRVFDGLRRQAGQVDGLPAQGPAAYPGEVEQVVYERGHVAAGRPDAGQVVESLVVENILVVFLQDLGEPVYGPQGRPEVVRNRVGERLQLPVGPLEFPVGVLQIFAGILGQGAAAHEHPGDTEEEEADAYAADEHEDAGRLLSAPLLNPGSVAKYRLHLRPATTLWSCWEKSGSYPSSPACCTPSSS